jgi:pyochelin biosynthetic protein PchC
LLHSCAAVEKSSEEVVMSNDEAIARWLRTFPTAPPDGPPVVCFPHAGGSVGWYGGLSAALAPWMRVSAVQYPGRLDRFRDALIDDLPVLAEHVAGALGGLAGGPVALFGHSMGAVVAFEVARRLEAAGGTVARLFVSGRFAPHLRRDGDVHLSSDDELVATVEALGGVPVGTLSRDDVRAVVLPQVRNDYRAIETHRFEPEPPLTTPITAVVGDHDPLVTVDDARAWRVHTRGDFTLEVLPGNHFAPAGCWDAVARIVRRDLAGRTAVAPPAPMRTTAGGSS